MQLIERLCKDDSVTDILINGGDDLWIDRGKGLEKIDVSSQGISTAEDVRALALSLARRAMVRLDDVCPIADGMITDLGNIRLNAVISPLVAKDVGALISLRKKNAKSWSLDELQVRDMLSITQMNRLKTLVKQNKNIIISGATGSGKTTLLSALLQEVPHTERIVGIEEACELSPSLHPGLVLMNARAANAEGIGEIKLASLLKSSMRMRPDRILLGECRGDEVREFLLALGSGFSGSFTTIHANSARGVRGRIETLAFMAGVYTKLTENQFDQYVDVIVHLRNVNGKRKVEEILELKTSSPKPVGLQMLGVVPDSHSPYQENETIVEDLKVDACEM